MLGDRSHDVDGARAHAIDCWAPDGGTARPASSTAPSRCSRRRATCSARTAGSSVTVVLRRGNARSAHFLTIASLRWVIRHRAVHAVVPGALLAVLPVQAGQPARDTREIRVPRSWSELYARPGLGRLILGRWLHLGVDTAIRPATRGTLRIGDKCTFARRNSINCYLDVELGDSVLVADGRLHLRLRPIASTTPNRPIKDQGIVKSRVRIGDDVWLGTKATVVRGVAIGDGAVVGANAVVTHDIPDYGVAVGSPARVIRSRR